MATAARGDIWAEWPAGARMATATLRAMGAEVTVGAQARGTAVTATAEACRQAATTEESVPATAVAIMAAESALAEGLIAAEGTVQAPGGHQVAGQTAGHQQRTRSARPPVLLQVYQSLNMVPATANDN
jgi:hypothetical protein